MGQSIARKKRLKQVREGRINPASLRGQWFGINPLERKTPTLAERLGKIDRKHKKKWNQSQDYRDDSIFAFISASCLSLPYAQSLTYPPPSR